MLTRTLLEATSIVQARENWAMETEGKRKIQVMKFVFMRENKVGLYWRVKKQNKRLGN